MVTHNEFYDVAIIGAGPAGCACALGSRDSGLRICLIDKCRFPREKVCGDAIPAQAMLQLEALLPGFSDRLLTAVPWNSFRKTRLVTRSGRSCTVEWSMPGYHIMRKDFDHHLLLEVKANTSADVFEGRLVRHLTRSAAGIHIDYLDGGDSCPGSITAGVVVAADGAPSRVARQLTGYKPSETAAGQAIRSYFSNLGEIPGDLPHVFTHPEFFPGYFWIFPLAGGRANAGFGIREADRKRLGLPLNLIFRRFIQEHPEVSRILAGATEEDGPSGGMVAFVDPDQVISHDRLLIAGDAASLVDPISGDGVQYAIRSGVLAASTIVRAFEGATCHSGELLTYSGEVNRHIRRTLSGNRQMVGLLRRMPWLLEVGISMLNSRSFSGLIRRLI